MIYHTKTRELRTDRGVLLKVLNCPLHKDWSQLEVVPNHQMRHCGSCSKSVVDLTGWSDNEAARLFEKSPQCCVYAAPDAPNIQIEWHYTTQKADPCPARRIATARGQDAINQAVKDGFWPLVKRVKPSRRIHSWMKVYQNTETGEVFSIGDLRYPLEAPWREIIKPFGFYPGPVHPYIAAYLIPPDLKVGERVFLTDLIEDRVAAQGGQGHSLRLDAAYAVWDGQNFKIEWDENKDASYWIG